MIKINKINKYLKSTFKKHAFLTDFSTDTNDKN